MKSSVRYRTLKPTDMICTKDAVYIDGKFVFQFKRAGLNLSVEEHVTALKQGAFGVLMSCVEVKRKRKQRNRTKAKWL